MLQKLHILPSAFLALSEEEQAFVIASIDCRVDEEKEAMKEAAAKK